VLILDSHFASHCQTCTVILCEAAHPWRYVVDYLAHIDTMTMTHAFKIQEHATRFCQGPFELIHGCGCGRGGSMRFMLPLDQD